MTRQHDNAHLVVNVQTVKALHACETLTAHLGSPLPQCISWEVQCNCLLGSLAVQEQQLCAICTCGKGSTAGRLSYTGHASTTSKATNRTISSFVVRL